MNTEKAIQLKKDYESKIQGLESEISNKSTQVQDLKRGLEDIKIEKIANEELKMLALEVIDCCHFWSLDFDSFNPYKVKIQDTEGFPCYILDYGREEKSIVKYVRFLQFLIGEGIKLQSFKIDKKNLKEQFEKIAKILPIREYDEVECPKCQRVDEPTGRTIEQSSKDMWARGWRIVGKDFVCPDCA